jgi:hypothetical protein
MRPESVHVTLPSCLKASAAIHPASTPVRDSARPAATPKSSSRRAVPRFTCAILQTPTPGSQNTPLCRCSSVRVTSTVHGQAPLDALRRGSVSLGLSGSARPTPGLQPPEADASHLANVCASAHCRSVHLRTAQLAQPEHTARRPADRPNSSSGESRKELCRQGSCRRGSTQRARGSI